MRDAEPLNERIPQFRLNSRPDPVSGPTRAGRPPPAVRVASAPGHAWERPAVARVITMRDATTQAPADGEPGSVAIARQPILDRDGRVCGYELLYRPLPISGEGPDDPEAASASVVVSALGEIGLEQLVEDQPAYINVTRRLLLDVGQLPLPPDRIVLELVENQLVDDPLLTILHELTAAGFRIALDDFILAADREPLLEVASIVKLDIRELDQSGLREHVTQLHGRGLTLIGEKVETRDEYERCRALGLDAFQGYYFATPQLVTGRRPPTAHLSTLATVTATTGTSAGFDELEAIITRDAGLSHRFLRLANSALFTRRTPVGSIHDGLTRLGAVTVRRWTLLLALSGLADSPHHLLELGLERARFCELLARHDATSTPERAFTAGLLSVLDALLDQPMHQLLAELSLDDNLAAALLHRHGPEGHLLATVEAYEHGNFEALHHSHIHLSHLASACRDALHWADATTTMLVNDALGTPRALPAVS